jgi:GR25 family glycosyltransferase involved in LPS biosynthesis
MTYYTVLFAVFRQNQKVRVSAGGLRRFEILQLGDSMVLPSSWSEVCSGKAIVMGLKRYAFRREYTAAKLAQLGFTNVEIVDAFDGFQDDVEGALKTLGIQFHPELRKGHKGNCFTMIREWKRFLDSGDEFRLFFEDDAIGHLELNKGLGQTFWDATPKDFDILYMGNMMNPGDPALAEKKALVVQVPTYCLHAYILSRKGAQRMLDLAKEMNARGEPLNMLDIQLVQWQVGKKLNWQCWNGTWIQKSYPTFDEGLPWQAFPDVITPQKDTGLFWQNMRVGTTLEHPTLQLTIPQYSR